MKSLETDLLCVSAGEALGTLARVNQIWHNAEAPSDQGPILHIEADDIDGTLAKIIENGGKTIVPKTKISDEFGHFALFLDNVGNRFGLWSS